MANMAYFNGTNAKLKFSDCDFTLGGFRAAFNIIIDADERPAAGSYYPLGIARIDENGYICVYDGSSSYPVVAAVNIADGLLHTCEVAIDSATSVVTVTLDTNNVYTGTSTWVISSIPQMGGDDSQEAWFKGFISNYQFYDGSSNLVYNFPLTSDFIATVGIGVATSEHVSIFDTDDFPYASQPSIEETAHNLGFYFVYNGYHYWCSETTTIGDCLHIGNGLAFSQSGAVLNFALPAAIPRNSRITEAYLIFVGQPVEQDSNIRLINEEGARSRIVGWKTASPYTFADWTAYKTIRGVAVGGTDDSNLTDNQVDMEIGAGQTINNGDVYFSPSLVNIVQEIVNLGDISSIALFWDDHNNRSEEGYGYLADYYPVLIVKYDTSEVECTVTYDANGGTGTVPVDSNPYEPGDPVTVPANINLTNTGYEFTGWSTHKDGEGTIIRVEDIVLGTGTFTIRANTVLYARWRVPHTVSYNANGADGGSAPMNETYHVGDTVIVQGNTGSNRMTKTGSTFRSWNTAADGSGETYLAGSTFTMGDSITLYAIWDLSISSSEDFSVAYVAFNNPADGYRLIPVPEAVDNTGAGRINDNISRIGYSIRFNLAAPIPRNATILSASLKGVGGMTIEWGENNDEEDPPPQIRCLIRAHLSPSPQAITGLTDYKTRRGIDGYAGQVTESVVNFFNEPITEGVAFTTPSLVPIVQELVGQGDDVTSVLFFIDDHSNYCEDFGIYSIDLPMEFIYSYECTLCYDGNGNTGGIVPANSTIYTSDDYITVLGNTSQYPLTRTGYIFSGWNTAADGSGTNYNQNDRFNIVADTVLYAQWTLVASSVKVIYNGNGNTGGTEPIDSRSYIYGTTATVLGNIGSLVKTGYTFSKWNTAADDSGTDYIPGNSFTVTANTTLYAQWTIAVAKVVTIVAWDTINDRGRTGDAANITVRGVRDGVEYAPVAASVTEVDAADMPGIYTVSLTESENDCYFNTVGGRSSSAGVVIKPTFWRNEEEQKCCCVCCCKKC